eukprot:gene18641-24382_t
MSKKRTCYIFLGAPGVGKGTFAKIITKQLGMKHFAIGDLIREEIANIDSPYSKDFEKYVSKGKLIPDHLINDIAINNIMHSSVDIILDGYPRNLSQAELLDKKLNLYNNSDHNISHRIVAVNIMLNKEVTIEKLLGRMVCKTCKHEFNSANIMSNGYLMPAILPNPETCSLGKDKCNPVMEKRIDDTIETITKRFLEFEAKTAPLIDFYHKKNSLITFNVKKGVKDAPDLMKLLLEN